MSLKLSDLIWGLALIILGIGVGGDVLRIWDFSVFFSGFWHFLSLFRVEFIFLKTVFDVEISSVSGLESPFYYVNGFRLWRCY